MSTFAVEIDGERIELPVQSCPDRHVVYLLLLEGEVVYVGQSKWPYQRLSHHRKTKTFDGWVFMEFDKAEALRIEGELLEEHQPCYNDRGTDSRALPDGVDPRRAEYLKEQHGKLPR